MIVYSIKTARHAAKYAYILTVMMSLARHCAVPKVIPKRMTKSESREHIITVSVDGLHWKEPCELTTVLNCVGRRYSKPVSYTHLDVYKRQINSVRSY